MNWLKTRFKSAIENIVGAALVDDARRKDTLFKWMNVILVVVSLVMTLVNFVTKEHILMISTFIFGMLSLMNVSLACTMHKGKQWLYYVFGFEVMVLMAFFFISGIPNGFSALWISIIPSFSLLIFGRKDGTVFSLAAFLMEIFLFWTPFGRGLLQYEYTDEFMLRFPLFYTAIYFMALLVETTRYETKKKLLAIEHEYRNLYRHDNLTGLYNRNAFNEIMKDRVANAGIDSVAMMIIDIDDFKKVNDTFGHICGDKVLQSIAETISKTVCKDATYCRWGGEEFVIFLHCEHDYLKTAEKIRRAVELSETEFEGDIHKVTISVGVCLAGSMSTTSVNAMLAAADICLYKAKTSGKNRVEYREV